MSARRTVTVRTRDHGPVALREPEWCTGRHHQDGGYRIDITHTGSDHLLTLPTREGLAVHLTTWLEARPYVTDSRLRVPFVAVEINGAAHPAGLAGLEAMAAALEASAEQLRERARELAVILAGGESR